MAFQGSAEIGVIGGDVRLDADRLADPLYGSMILPALMGERAEQMQGVGMTRIYCQTWW